MPAALPGHAPCSACGAAVRDGAPWCTLCLTPAARPAQQPAALVVDDARLDPLTAPFAEPVAPAVSTAAVRQVEAPAGTPPVQGGWPCTSCGHPNSLELSACGACGSPFLARLAAEDAPSLVLPLVGDMRTLSRGHHLALAGAVVTGVLVVLVLITLVGALLG